MFSGTFPSVARVSFRTLESLENEDEFDEINDLRHGCFAERSIENQRTHSLKIHEKPMLCINKIATYIVF